VPIAWFWLWFWGLVPGFDAGPWEYFVSAMLATVALGWLFHVRVERPMTLALNRRLAAPHNDKELHRKTP
jgi:peptidoglycan/LPS O-acetylase OafA/YrhL